MTKKIMTPLRMMILIVTMVTCTHTKIHTAQTACPYNYTQQTALAGSAFVMFYGGIAIWQQEPRLLNRIVHSGMAFTCAMIFTAGLWANNTTYNLCMRGIR